jgi:hypothetical protein
MIGGLDYWMRLKDQIRSFNGKPQALTSSLLHFACAYGSPLN